ncbi:MAG: TSUP family transporter [Oscillospiraceae bacterium]|nr:TSUP family transporter [Oscillospiraceae bacterium]
MLDSLPVTVLVGAVLGFLSGLGVGGGSLFILWLTLVLGLPHAQARVWNLIFFLPCALISSLFRLKQKSLPLKKVWPAMVLGCVCAGAFSLLSPHIHLGLLKKGFGVLLLVTGIREVFYKRKV